MSILVIDVWKKGTDKYTSNADYHIEVDEGETHEVSALIHAIGDIAKAIEKV